MSRCGALAQEDRKVLRFSSMNKFIQDITREAGKKVLKLFGKVGVKYTKTHASDPVTEADLVSHRYLVSQIKKKYPEHRIISEEGEDGNKDSNDVWIIDPLDGTLNFSRRIPMFGIIVCYVKNNIPSYAAISLPYFNEMIFAKRGKGVFKNGKRIYASRQKHLMHSVGCVPASIVKNPKRIIVERCLDACKNVPFGIMVSGCNAWNAALVADGRRDWMMMWAEGMWERVAISLILKEAGCKVTNFKGREWGLNDLEVLAGNPVFHKELTRVMRRAW